MCLQNALLSEATIEYGFALLMNLCLRSAGKAASQQVAAPLVHLCERYLDSKNPQVKIWELQCCPTASLCRLSSTRLGDLSHFAPACAT